MTGIIDSRLDAHTFTRRSGRVARVGIVSTYPPTRCGIARYTAGLVEHLERADPDLVIDVEQGESIQTEISAKFRLDTLPALMEGAGLRLDRSWTDPDGDFALSLATVPT